MFYVNVQNYNKDLFTERPIIDNFMQKVIIYKFTLCLVAVFVRKKSKLIFFDF